MRKKLQNVHRKSMNNQPICVCSSDRVCGEDYTHTASIRRAATANNSNNNTNDTRANRGRKEPRQTE